MKDKNNFEKLKALINDHIVEKETIDSFNEVLKSIEKESIATEFKLKRTLRDRQITVNVLSNTIQRLEEKSIAIEQHKELIEEQSKYKEELFANVSHELRTPLQGIIGMNQLLENTQLKTTQKDYVDIIKSSADNLLVIINDLLSFSEINTGKIKILQEPFSILKLCNDLENILALQARNKGLKLMVMLPPDLPELLIGDQTRIYQILLNLLNNAMKFTHEGFVMLNINILEKKQNRITLQFEIKDTGIGIEPDRLDMIFESFTQAHDNNSVVYEGAGLGLNIVKNLLNNMGGEIEVKSKKGNGTSFGITLTLNIPDQAAIEEFKNKRSEIVIPLHWRNKNILLIEDNKANLLYAKNLFLEWGISLKIAETIEEAELKITSEKFDCILSDVKLPDGNGLDLIRKMRIDHSNLNQNTPVMVLTASSNKKEAKYSKQIGIQSYIGKPFKAKLIVEELKKIIVEEPQSDEFCEPSYSVLPKATSKEQYFEPLEKNFNGKKKYKVEMIEILLYQLPIAQQKMQHALSNNDIETFFFEAHSIKSTIFNIGLPKLQPLIVKMNEYCLENIHLEELPTLFNSFKDIANKDVQIMLKKKEELMAFC